MSRTHVGTSISATTKLEAGVISILDAATDERIDPYGNSSRSDSSAKAGGGGLPHEMLMDSLGLRDGNFIGIALSDICNIFVMGR